jgi:hypothetical protein
MGRLVAEQGDTEHGELLEARPLEDTDPRVFTTDPENPGEGQTYVWARTQWFERVESGTGAIEFSPLPYDEPTLHEWLSEQGLEITELDDGFTEIVREEFLEQTPLYPEAPELSNQEA